VARSLSFIAAFFLLLRLLTAPALAQTSQESWQDFRREDLGFKIEMPGTPKVENDESAVDGKTIKSVSAQVDFDERTLGVSYEQLSEPVVMTADTPQFREDCDGRRKHLEKALVVKGTSHTQTAPNSQVPMCEIRLQTQGFHAIARAFVLRDRTIQVIVTSLRPIEGDAVVQRFLDSFELLPN